MKLLVSGNREVNEQYVKKEFKEILNEFELDTLICGGAWGTNLICAEIAQKNNINTVMYLPFPNHNKLWKSEDIERFNNINCEKKIVSFNTEILNFSELYKIRNQIMVDLCDYGIVFWSGNIKSGTFSTMKMLEKANKLKYIFHTNLNVKQKIETQDLSNFF